MIDEMTQEQAIELIEHYGSEILSAWLLTVFIAIFIGVIAILFKSLLENLAGYITFRLDKYIKVGTPVKYESIEYRIKSASITQLVLENDDEFKTLPIKKWTNHEFSILKDKHKFNQE